MCEFAFLLDQTDQPSQTRTLTHTHTHRHPRARICLIVLALALRLICTRVEPASHACHRHQRGGMGVPIFEGTPVEVVSLSCPVKTITKRYPEKTTLPNGHSQIYTFKRTWTISGSSPGFCGTFSDSCQFPSHMNQKLRVVWREPHVVDSNPDSYLIL